MRQLDLFASVKKVQGLRKSQPFFLFAYWVYNSATLFK